MVDITLHFFFNDAPATEIYTLSLHDALPICSGACTSARYQASRWWITSTTLRVSRSEEHTSELQSLRHLVCCLLLEKNNAAVSTVVPSIGQPRTMTVRRVKLLP